MKLKIPKTKKIATEIKRSTMDEKIARLYMS